LELAFQGGGTFSGGYVTTNTFGLTVCRRQFHLNGTLTGTNTWQAGSGNLVGANVIKAGLTWVAGSWNGAVVTAASNTLVSISGGVTMIWPIAPSPTTAPSRGARPHTRRGTPGTLIYNNGVWDSQGDLT